MDLSFVEEALLSLYHPEGTRGRPPKNPLGLFKLYLGWVLKGPRHLRELERELMDDESLREFTGFTLEDLPSHGLVVGFRKRVNPQVMNRLIEHVLSQLVDLGFIRAERVAVDATALRAYSRRDPVDDQRGLSDPDARVGWTSRGWVLGYKLHWVCDADSEMPIAFQVAPANRNEKAFFQELFQSTKRRAGRVRVLVADQQYSSSQVRRLVQACGAEPVIPYPPNQRRGEPGLLRVDKRFRVHGPPRPKTMYKLRGAIERLASRIKDRLNQGRLLVRRLKQVTVLIAMAIYGILAIALTAHKTGKPNKARSIKHFTG